MHRIALTMTMSSDESLLATEIGLKGVRGVRVMRRPSPGTCVLEIVISTDDPDDVDIAREVVWQLDPDAIQESLVLLEVVRGDLMVG